MAELETCLLFPAVWVYLIRHCPSLQKKDAVPFATESTIEHSEQIGIKTAVLFEGMVTPELCSKKAI